MNTRTVHSCSHTLHTWRPSEGGCAPGAASRPRPQGTLAGRARSGWHPVHNCTAGRAPPPLCPADQGFLHPLCSRTLWHHFRDRAVPWGLHPWTGQSTWPPRVHTSHPASERHTRFPEVPTPIQAASAAGTATAWGGRGPGVNVPMFARVSAQEGW